MKTFVSKGERSTWSRPMPCFGGGMKVGGIIAIASMDAHRRHRRRLW
jgi:hypothetical protein